MTAILPSKAENEMLKSVKELEKVQSFIILFISLLFKIVWSQNYNCPERQSFLLVANEWQLTYIKFKINMRFGQTIQKIKC